MHKISSYLKLSEKSMSQTKPGKSVDVHQPNIAFFA